MLKFKMTTISKISLCVSVNTYLLSHLQRFKYFFKYHFKKLII